MNKTNWDDFTACRNQFKRYTEEITGKYPRLKSLQNCLIAEREGPKYEIVHPVVYNTALDDIDTYNEIKLILVGDNPGRREQESGRYLVGPSGKIADSFFKSTPELSIDFRKNVIILNKTPIHTPRTAALKELAKKAGANGEILMRDTQIFMADLLCRFFAATGAAVWIIGYSEMKSKGIFSVYTERLQSLLKNNKIDKQKVYIFRHFSMNQFTIDLKKQTAPNESAAAALKRIGQAYRSRVLGE